MLSVCKADWAEWGALAQPSNGGLTAMGRRVVVRNVSDVILGFCETVRTLRPTISKSLAGGLAKATLIKKAAASHPLIFAAWSWFRRILDRRNIRGRAQKEVLPALITKFAGALAERPTTAILCSFPHAQ